MYQSLKIAVLDFLYTDNSVLHAREQLQQSITEKKDNHKKQLLVDISVIIRSDVRTGIQRVVRALLKQLLESPPAGYTIKPVFASADFNYHFAPENFSLNQDKANIISAPAEPVSVFAGDVFLGLDLAAHILPRHQAQLARWKQKGVKIHIVVYDLLPVLHPKWFHSKTTRNFYRWLKSVAILADSVICISSTVKQDLMQWVMNKYAFVESTLPIHVILMGGDISASLPSRGMPDDADNLLAQFKAKPTVLMVGTLEPRKGHAIVLDAFECLWRDGHEVNLLIIGKCGWKTERLQTRLAMHPQNKSQLFWFNDISDEFLEKIYPACFGLILASEGEGFGLPLIEAMHHNKPVLARDIPVLREIGGNFVTFFSGTSIKSLMNDIEFWLAKIVLEQTPHSAPQHTWQDSAHELLIHLGLEQTALAQPHQDQVSQPLNRENVA